MGTFNRRKPKGNVTQFPKSPRSLRHGLRRTPPEAPATATRRPPPSRHLPAAERVHHGRAVLRVLRDRDGDEPAVRPGRDRHFCRHGAGRGRRPRRAPDQYAERIRRPVRQPVGHGVLRRRAGAGHVRVVAARPGQDGAGWPPSSIAPAARCAWRASTPTSPWSTSAISRACRARRRRRWWPASSG